jgi:tetratricopeptide (TPR) repeat protein
MKHRRPQKKENRQPSARRPTGSSAASAVELPAGRKWLFRLLAVSVVPLIFLGGAELCLRLVGFGYDSHFFKSEEVNGQDCYVANEDFGRRFFPRGMVRVPPPVVVPRVKAPETFRIFIFGESAALGDPRPNYGAGSFLEVLLAERFPQAKFEIINTSVTAINSHAIRPIARESAAHAGDLWIIYMGNNEMVGPFGAATIFGTRAPPLWWVRMQLQLQKLRLSQLLLSVGELRPQAKSAANRWAGMEMFMQNQVRPDDPGKQRAYRNFERNLDDILQAGRAARAKIVLSTVAVNLKDCPPFGSVPLATDRAAAEQLCRDGTTALAEGRFEAARSAFESAAALGDPSAEVQFQLATSLLRLTNAPAARSHFLQAADVDTLPFRADSRINETIRAAATRLASESVTLCDAAEVLSAASPHGIPGEELLYEHVHLNPDGNYALALAWAAAVEKLLPPELKGGAQSAWLSQPECEQWLGLTDWNRVSILEEVLRRIQRPPFSGQSGQAERIARLEKSIAALRQQFTEEAATKAREIYERALLRAPKNYWLHANYAEFLEARREWQPAAAARRKVCELAPASYFPLYALGVVLKEAGELAEAHEVLLRAVALKKDDSEVWLELGIVSGRQSEWDQARQELETARRFEPDDPRIPLYLGEVLWKLNRRDEAVAVLRDAIRLDPTNWQPHFRLAHILAQQGNYAAAAAEYREALRLDPTSLRSKLGLVPVLANLGRREEALQQLREVLQVEPNNRTALELEQKLLGR